MAGLFDIPLTRLDGTPASLAEYAGKVLLIVNVASKCGLTPQYEGLENLHRAWRDRGLVVLGFPSNDFAGQEPGTDEEIGRFCRSVYGVDFPMFSKIEVSGPGRHPLYSALIATRREDVTFSFLWLRNWVHSASRAAIETAFARSFAGLRAGPLRSGIDTVFSLSDLPTALTRQDDPTRTGKLLLAP